MTAAARLLRLDEIGEGDRQAAGGKAFALAALKRAGLPVPDGFVVPPGAEDEAAVAAAYAALGGPVAVRSSGAWEDGAEASFAGQLRTELAVAGAASVLAAIARCRAATPDAAAYATAMGAAAEARVPVLVQRFVEPVAAGVCFTTDPRDPSAMVVEAHPGRGDALVSGRVSPDRYAVDRATGAPRGPTGGCLDAGALAVVAALARRAEAVFGAPQDVEWAIGPAGPVLLQSRPITVEAEAAAHPAVRRLTRANVGEVLPGPVTPLTASVVVGFLEHGFTAVARRAGLLHELSPPFLVVHAEHLYLNLTLCAEIVARLPGVSAAEAERLVLGGGGASPPHVSARSWPALAPVAYRLLGMARGLEGAIADAAAAVRAMDRRRADVARADGRGLLREWDALVEAGRGIAVTHILASGASAVTLSVLSRVLGAWAPGDPVDRVNRLTAGLDGVESALPTAALEEIAEACRRDPAAMRWLRAPAGIEAAPPEIAARLLAFLERHGHRGMSEGELAATTWADDPAALLPTLAVLAGAPSIARAAAADRRQADEDALRSAAGVLAPALARVIARAQDGVRERERTKSLAIRFIARLRGVARQAGALLAAGGRLAHADDVFFLRAPELRAALEGAATVARRRRRHQRAAGAPVPREVDLLAPLAAADGDGRLGGVAVSAGIAVGPARVIGPGQAPSIAAGEVLVAPVLDAAYGPLLASAAGAVAEMGGLLSHGAVVARELGVPCVVDVRGATRRIATGQRVRVDGGAGTVEILAEAVAGAPPAERATLPASPPADEAFHPLEDHRDARESVYFNVQDPATGLALVASAGVRRGGRGEALIALSRRPGDVLFAVELAGPRGLPGSVAVGGLDVTLDPLRVVFDGRVASHRGEFPPPPVAALLTPRDVALRVDLRFSPAGPAIDFTRALPDDVRESLRPLGARHVEQSGRWSGTVAVDGRVLPVDGTGSRDHTWGRRDWSAADWWRLFTLRLGDDVALHALAVSARGRIAEGGFLWREDRAEPLVRVSFAPRREGGRLRALVLEVTTASGEAIRVEGEVERTITVPVDPDRRPLRHLAGRPYRLLLDENFTRYASLGRTGHGMAEITVR